MAKKKASKSTTKKADKGYKCIRCGAKMAFLKSQGPVDILECTSKNCGQKKIVNRTK